MQLQLYACWQMIFCHNKVSNVYKMRNWKLRFSNHNLEVTS